MLQIVLTLAIFVILVIPMGKYMYHIATDQKTLADKVFDPIDRIVYKVCGIKGEEMGWKKYALSLLMANGVMVLTGYFILRIQGLLFLNPNGIDGMEASLSFNTIISFMTNTNLQHYSGESGLSYAAQMCVIIFMMFTSAASGYAACMAFCRGLAGKKIGNFYVDMVRTTTRILLPLAFLVGLFLVSQGVPQTLAGNVTVGTIEGTWQDIARGPVAALESIKHLGTNGGGFFGANSSTPFENPTVLSDIAELISMMILPGACVVTFGHMLHDCKKERGEGAVIFGAMAIIFAIGLTICFSAEKAGNPVIANLGISQEMGNMEGKEVRFGIDQSSLFTTVTTSFTTGTVNNMHDSLTPLGGMVPMLLMQLGEIVFGGIGCGLYSMIGFVILTVFIAGLMVGRTPEYLGKKIGPKEMRMAVVLAICTPVVILVGAAAMCLDPATFASLSNAGPHGFSEVLYAATSAGGNNGSAFAGMDCNTPFLNTVLGLEMLANRFVPMAAALCLAGSLSARQKVAASAGTLSTSNAMFVFLLILIVALIAALSMFPALALGPIAEQLQMVL